MEYGPRALGNRSIIANPTKNKYKDKVNIEVKFREEWRPFCPSMLYEAKDNYLINPADAPYMITSFDVPKDKIKDIEELMKKMVFHVIALNTVVKDIWEEKIWDDFDFSYNSCSKKTIRVAWTNKLLPTQVVDYVKNRKLYIMRLLDPRLKENPA